MNCSELREQLGDYLDEASRAELCRAIDEHLSRCPDCRVEVDTLRKTIVLYHRDTIKQEIPYGVRERLYQALAREYRGPS